MSPVMATFGLLPLTPAGRPIATANGCGKTTMAGPGSAPILGAGRPITTAAGSTGRLAGAGTPGRYTHTTTGHPRWSLSSGSEAAIPGSALDLDSVMSGGSR